MLNEKDIYTHLKNGGSIEDLQKALENEIAAAQDKIIKENAEQLKAKEKAKEVENRKACALVALTGFCTAAEVDYSVEELETLLTYLEKGAVRFGKGLLNGKSFFDLWF